MMLVLVMNGNKPALAGGGTSSSQQLYYRFRADLDGLNTAPSGWLALQNGEITDVQKGTTYRVRFTASQEGTAIDRNNDTRFQYGTSSDCTSGSWTDVPATATTEHFQMSNSGQFTDGDATTANLLTAGEPNRQNGAGYDATNPGAAIKFNLDVDYYTEYEWSFTPTSNATDGATYYLRTSDDLESYPACAKLTIAAASGSLTVDIVDSGGNPVAGPTMAMNTVDFSFNSQNVTGTFGVASQKVRVDNGTANPQWTLSLAASATTDFWNSAGSDYDFNDPTAGAGDGGDADSVGGQMTVDPSISTITPQGGCSTTGLTKGSSTAFSEGATDTVTLLTAGPSAEASCYWDVTGIGISQSLPAEQPAASDYNIDMVLSVIAV